MKTNTVTKWTVIDAHGYTVTNADNRAEARMVKNLLNTTSALKKFFGVNDNDMPFRIAKTVVTK